MPPLLRALAALLLALLVPPAAVALAGGADLDAFGARFAWYDAAGPALGLVAAALAAVLAPRGRVGQALLALGLLQAAVVAWVLWVGEIDTEALSVSRTERPGGIALALVGLGVAIGAARGRLAAARLPAALGVVGGAALLLVVDVLDRQAMAAALPGGRPAVAARAAADDPPDAPAPVRPDVVLVLVDTLRADALGIYGAEPSPTPFLDAFLAEGRVYDHAIAQAPWTFPSMASLFTSRLPSALDPTRRGAAMDKDEGMPRLAPAAPRLAEHLRATGYHTAGFQKNPYLAPGSGFERGFDVYEMVGGDTAEDHAGAQTTNAALRWARVAADARREGRLGPYFLFVHYMDPHIDYRPPRRFRQEDTRAYEGFVDGSQDAIDRVRKTEGGPRPEDLAQLRRLYRDEVRYLDAQVRRLVEGLRERGLWTADRDVLVFTADHGEQFHEHGRFKHQHVWIENVHVPLAIRAPELPPGRDARVVRLLDVAPTVVDLADVPPLPGAQGASLLAAGPRPPAVTEFGGMQRLTAPGWSVIRERSGKLRVFDRGADPGEQRDLG
ncbi:MAG: sulfatase, partial [Myxococcota bacterium]|nr:sulfatase [Myxococcota bacterium]